MPEVIPSNLRYAQSQVQPDVFRRGIHNSAPLVLWRMKTMAITFSFTRTLRATWERSTEVAFEENSTSTAVVSHADRVRRIDTSEHRKRESESNRHDRNRSRNTTLYHISSRPVVRGNYGTRSRACKGGAPQNL